MREILSKLHRHVAMVTTRGDQGNGRRATRAVYYQLLMATIVVAYLVTSCNCLPASKEKQSHSDGKVLLTIAISEFEDALSRLKQYANGLSEKDRSTNEEDEDPLAESVERESRDEDYRQEPEIVPGLDRFEKNLDEAAGSSGRSGQKSGASSSHDQSSDKDDLNEISLQDLLNFVRETVKDRKKEGESKGNEPVVKSTTKLTTVSADKSKDISLKDLMEFLKERKNQKNKDHTGLATQNPEVPSERKVSSGETKTKTAVKDDSSDVSLKDALEYLASLKKKLNDNERTE